MMKLAVPAVEQAWASTIAAPAASPGAYYEGRLPTDSLKGQNPRFGLAWQYSSLSGSVGIKQHCTK
ncbi:MAG TPA: hypothetical protein VMW50_08890 [Dehalococcoidia bacterium]|nr:hypothetical protein [Dehalococcoidia bacterium]